MRSVVYIIGQTPLTVAWLSLLLTLSRGVTILGMKECIQEEKIVRRCRYLNIFAVQLLTIFQFWYPVLLCIFATQRTIVGAFVLLSLNNSRDSSRETQETRNNGSMAVAIVHTYTYVLQLMQFPTLKDMRGSGAGMMTMTLSSCCGQSIKYWYSSQTIASK